MDKFYLLQKKIDINNFQNEAANLLSFGGIGIPRGDTIVNTESIVEYKIEKQASVEAEKQALVDVEKKALRALNQDSRFNVLVRRNIPADILEKGDPNRFYANISAIIIFKDKEPRETIEIYNSEAILNYILHKDGQRLDTRTFDNFINHDCTKLNPVNNLFLQKALNSDTLLEEQISKQNQNLLLFTLKLAATQESVRLALIQKLKDKPMLRKHVTDIIESQHHIIGVRMCADKLKSDKDFLAALEKPFTQNHVATEKRTKLVSEANSRFETGTDNKKEEREDKNNKPTSFDPSLLLKTIKEGRGDEHINDAEPKEFNIKRPSPGSKR